MEIIEIDRPLSGYLRRYKIQTDETIEDLTVYCQLLIPQLLTLCQNLLHDLDSFKLHVRIKIKFNKVLDAETTSEAFFSNKQATILAATDIQVEIDDIVTFITNRIDEFCHNGSDWVIHEVVGTDIHVARYQPLAAANSTFMNLPKSIARKRAIINVVNDDFKCFKWAVLSALHPCRMNANRPQQYRKYEHRYNFDAYTFPFKLTDIKKFEDEHNLSIMVYGIDKSLYPLYRPKTLAARRILLLYLYNEKTDLGHYCWIKDLNKLLYCSNKHRARMYFCPLCLFSFTTQARLDSHVTLCRSDGCAIEMPSEEEKILKFKSVAKMLRQPCVFYADFECLLERCDSAMPSSSTSYSTATSLHTPCGYAMIQVIRCCNNSPPNYPHVIHHERHQNVVRSFLEKLVQQSIAYQENFVEKRQPMPVLTGAEWNDYFTKPNCIICDKAFTASCPICSEVVSRRQWCKECRSRICRDHCHVCRAFRGPAHSGCNISYRMSTDVCVFMHNMKRYDGHLIMQQIAPFANANGYSIDCIPKAIDSYVMFALKMIPINEHSKPWKIKFLDSLQFISCSLDKLVTNLRAAGDDTFHAMSAHFEDKDQLQLMLRKGVYPYEYMDSWDRFDEKQLPPIEDFYSTVSEANISNEDYHHACDVWEAFGLTTLGQYHDLYVSVDTLLLCDVIENFRSLCLHNYRLDPAHYVTLPSFGWDAVLGRSPVSLELLTDPDMYTFFECGIRGGVSMVTMRYAKANNPLLPGYDEAKDTSFIASFDANNLYGYAMSQALPVAEFAWLSQEEMECLDVMQIPDDSDYGCILDVELHYPDELHEPHNCYPLAPEHVTVTDDMLSVYSTTLKEQLGLKTANQEKLVPNLYNKTSYISHYRNLKLYISLGMKIVNINRGIKFKQLAWMKPYINFNTEQRKLAKSDFEKDLFKLLNNSVFGKSMENVRGYSNVDLVTTPEAVRRKVANPRFNRFEVFDNDLVAVVMNKKRICLKKPIYTGFTVLELSKHLMYDFHYNFMLPAFPRTTLLFTDTDSLTYYIKTHDLYKELQTHATLFDFSDYPEDHFLHDKTNKKVMGKMKDETDGVPIEEFVGLRSKMYSIKCDHHNKKRAKGVSKTTVKKRISHDDYRETLANGTLVRHSSCQIRNAGHQMYTLSCNKISLSAFDDKRFILNDGIQTVAHGHHLIRALEDIESDEETQQISPSSSHISQCRTRTYDGETH